MDNESHTFPVASFTIIPELGVAREQPRQAISNRKTRFIMRSERLMRAVFMEI